MASRNVCRNIKCTPNRHAFGERNCFLSGVSRTQIMIEKQKGDSKCCLPGDVQQASKPYMHIELIFWTGPVGS